MSYKVDSITEDCYPGTTCLINKFGIRDEAKLAMVEAGITALKEAELLENPLSGDFDFEHYKKSTDIFLRISIPGQEK